MRLCIYVRRWKNYLHCDSNCEKGRKCHETVFFWRTHLKLNPILFIRFINVWSVKSEKIPRRTEEWQGGNIYIYIAHFLLRKFKYKINFAMVSSTPENPLLKKEYFLKNDWRPLYKGAVSRLKEKKIVKIQYTVQYNTKVKWY